MSRPPVDLRVGGQTYRIVSSADPAELQHLAQLVDARLREIAGAGRPIQPQTLVLAALSLAHDAEQERARRLDGERRHRDQLTTLLGRIDRALEQTPLPPPASVHPES